MKTTNTLILIAAIFIGACAPNDPVSVTDKAVNTLTVVDRSLVVAVENHYISKAQATALLPYYEAVRAAKEVAVQAAVANDKQGVDLALQALASALDTYNAELAKAKLDHAKAATTKP